MAKKKSVKRTITKKSKTTKKPVAKKATNKKVAVKKQAGKNVKKKTVVKKASKPSVKKPVLKKNIGKAKLVAKKPIAKNLPVKKGKILAKKPLIKKVDKKVVVKKEAKKAEVKKIADVKPIVKEIKKMAEPKAFGKEINKPAMLESLQKQKVVPRRKKKIQSVNDMALKEERGRKKAPMPKLKPLVRPVMRPALIPIKQNTYVDPNKTRYSDEELLEFRDLIVKKLENAKSELRYLQEQISRSSELGGDDDARFKGIEDGTMHSEREYLSQMASRQIQYISHLEKALVRIENKTYGICRETGKLISKERLRAVPHATLSMEAKQQGKG